MHRKSTTMLLILSMLVIIDVDGKIETMNKNQLELEVGLKAKCPVTLVV